MMKVETGKSSNFSGSFEILFPSRDRVETEEISHKGSVNPPVYSLSEYEIRAKNDEDHLLVFHKYEFNNYYDDAMLLYCPKTKEVLRNQLCSCAPASLIEKFEKNIPRLQRGNCDWRTINQWSVRGEKLVRSPKTPKTD